MYLKHECVLSKTVFVPPYPLKQIRWLCCRLSPLSLWEDAAVVGGREQKTGAVFACARSRCSGLQPPDSLSQPQTNEILAFQTRALIMLFFKRHKLRDKHSLLVSHGVGVTLPGAINFFVYVRFKWILLVKDTGRALLGRGFYRTSRCPLSSMFWYPQPCGSVLV